MIRRALLVRYAAAACGWALWSLGRPAQAADPTSTGTWDLNTAQSRSTDPLPRSGSRTYVATATTETMTGSIVTADGKTLPLSFTATLDGKDCPYQGPGVDTLALTKVDALTIAYVTKLAGKQVATGTRVLSQDGKIMTFTQKGINAAGKPVESTVVYEKR
jgi:hypothetical protein